MGKRKACDSEETKGGSKQIELDPLENDAIYRLEQNVNNQVGTSRRSKSYKPNELPRVYDLSKFKSSNLQRLNGYQPFIRFSLMKNLKDN